MRFDEFEREARTAYRRIPDEYRVGVDGLVVSREALPHPTHPEIYTLGMCYTEPYPSDWGGPETTRSVVTLYWGSFQRLAEADPGFDWEEELWETLTHELRHHLEFLADEDALEGVDYAMEQEFARFEGLEFDPWYYQSGEEVAEGLYQVERRFYLERLWAPEAFEEARRVELRWHGRAYWIPRPGSLGDVHFVRIRGPDLGAASLELVLVRRRSWWESLRTAFAGRQPEVHESEARARPAGGAGEPRGVD